MPPSAVISHLKSASMPADTVSSKQADVAAYPYDDQSPAEINRMLDLDNRIVGGADVDIQQVPWQVSLRIYSYHICGASIISTTWCVTAGHCYLTDYSITDYHVYVGSSLLASGTIYSVSSIVMHPQYSKATMDYDACLVQTTTPIIFNDKIRPIRLQRSQDLLPVDKKANITGWGYLSENKTTASPTLQRVTLPILSRAKCSKIYGTLITPRMICCGVMTNGTDACKGDSGGPMVWNNRLVGIVSWGYGCAREGYPGVYTYVASIVNWINKTVT